MLGVIRCCHISFACGGFGSRTVTDLPHELQTATCLFLCLCPLPAFVTCLLGFWLCSTSYSPEINALIEAKINQKHKSLQDWRSLAAFWRQLLYLSRYTCNTTNCIVKPCDDWGLGLARLFDDLRYNSSLAVVILWALNTHQWAKHNSYIKAGSYWEYHVKVNWIAKYLSQKSLGNLKQDSSKCLWFGFLLKFSVHLQRQWCFLARAS